MTRYLLVATAAFLLYLPTVRQRNLKDCGASSRLATVESLVERGTFAIGGSTFAYTCDRLTRGGRLYSDKPPTLSVAAAGVYAVLHRGFGLSFNPAADPHRNRLPDPTYWWMTVLVVVTAQALLVATFDRAVGESGLTGGGRLLATAACAFSTLLWTLTATFNPHPVAAALLLAGARWLWLSRPARPLAAGAVLGFAAAVDLPLGLLALAIGVALGAARSKGGGGRGALVLGALPGLLVHAALNLAVVGDIKPPQMHRELYTAATGHSGASATGYAQDAGLAFYAGRNLVGALGLFALTPLALLLLGAAAREALRPGPRRRLAVAAVTLLAAAAAVYVAVWPQAVGCSYGMRHLAPALPPLLLVAAPPLLARRRRSFVVLALVSAAIAGVGLVNPTTCAGFVEDRRGLVPARVFWVTLAEIRGRLGGR